MLRGVSPASFALFDTAIGRCALVWGERGVARVQLPEADDAGDLRSKVARAPSPGATSRSPAPRRPDPGRHRGHPARTSRGRMDALHARGASTTPTSRSSTAASTRRCGVWGRARPWATASWRRASGRRGRRGRWARPWARTRSRSSWCPCHRVLAAGGRAGGFLPAHGGRSRPSEGCWRSRASRWRCLARRAASLRCFRRGRRRAAHLTKKRRTPRADHRGRWGRRASA